MQRRKRRTLAFGACVLAFYLLHFGWFVLFGPPQWFQGVAERAPQLSAVVLDSSFDDLLREFEEPQRAAAGAAGLPDNPAAVGQIVRVDRLGPAGPALQQTRDGNRGHLYVWSPDREVWREQLSLEGAWIDDARWLRTDRGPRVVLAQRRPWWPFGRNYARFWLALLRPELRADGSLTLFEPAADDGRYLFPGLSPLPSPDRGAIAFLRSEPRGFHSIHLWRPGTDEVTTVVSSWEADPGTGVSFSYAWSSDSRALFVRGVARGFDGAPALRPRNLRLLYDVEGDRLIDLAVTGR